MMMDNKISLYGNDFKCVSIKIHVGIRLFVCNLVRSILIVLLGDVILDSDWLSTTFSES